MYSVVYWYCSVILPSREWRNETVRLKIVARNVIWIEDDGWMDGWMDGWIDLYWNSMVLILYRCFRNVWLSGYRDGLQRMALVGRLCRLELAPYFLFVGFLYLMDELVPYRGALSVIWPPMIDEGSHPCEWVPSFFVLLMERHPSVCPVIHWSVSMTGRRTDQWTTFYLKAMTLR